MKIPTGLIEDRDQTLDDIDAAMEERAALEQERPYFGMSGMKDCARAMWYGFRWAVKPAFKAGTLRKFEDGHRTEDLMAARLRMVEGITLYTHDPATGKQFGFQDFGGHFKGHMDGAIKGIYAAPKKWHVWECKASGDDVYTKFLKAKKDKGSKSALKDWNPTYYAQAQLYMHYSKMDRHYLTVTSAGGRDHTSCRTEYSQQDAEQFIARAESVIFADEPPLRPYSADFFKCKWCDFRQICHNTEAPNVNCRTCAHSTVQRAGGWTCDKAEPVEITVEQQRAGCGSHRYIPILLDNFAEMVTANAGDVAYRNKLTENTFTNGDLSSVEIKAAQDKSALGDPDVQALRAAGATITG
jgi:ribosomal protein S27E